MASAWSGGEEVGLTRLMQLLGKNRFGIEQLIAEGLPAVARPETRGGNWVFNTSQVFHWMANRHAGGEVKLDLNAERARLAREQADAQELKNRQARGELLPAEEVEGLWQSAAGRCRSILLGIPNSSAERIVLLARREEKAEDAAKAVRTLLTSQIDGALAEMARLEVEDDDDGAGAPGEPERAA